MSTPPRSWAVVLDGLEYKVAYTAGLATDRPDTIVIDGLLREIRWERLPKPPRRKASHPYEARFDLAGHDSVLRWEVNETPPPVSARRRWSALAIDVLGALMGAGTSSYLDRQGTVGSVSLEVDGRQID